MPAAALIPLIGAAVGGGGALALGATAATAIGAAGLGAALGSGIGTADAASSASSQASAIANNLQYQPINIASVTSAAQQQASANAANSLALQQQLQPNAYASNAELQAQTADQLRLQGQLPPDVANQVATAGRVAGGAAGAGGASGPLTASLIGNTALGLQQQRMSNAASLAAANPPPVSGLDPGSLASLLVSQNSAQNQFNLEKAGAQTSALNTGAQLTASGYGTTAGLLGSVLNFSKGLTTNPTTPTSTLPATAPNFSNTGLGSLNYSLLNPAYASGQ